MTELTKTSRGFSILNFEDSYGLPCSVQCSSAVDFDYENGLNNPGSSYLWIGIDDVQPKIMARDAWEYGVETDQTTGWVPYPIPERVLLSSRMHLNREQVQELINHLQHWLDNDDL